MTADAPRDGSGGLERRRPDEGPIVDPDGGTYAIGTWLFGRLLGLVFLVAFASFHVQCLGLVGPEGIWPATEVLAALAEQGLGVESVPTLAWWTGADANALHGLCIAGEGLSLLLLFGWLPGPAALGASALYLSLIGVGGMFMAYQWDSLLVEAGVLASLALPWAGRSTLTSPREPPRLARYALWFLLFRLIFTSGVVKLASGDAAWRMLTALDYHYWTQPLPNPIAYWVHQLPTGLQRASCALALGIELALPFGIVLGRRGRRASAVGLGGLMLLIALTGNYGFFNLLAVALCLTLVDDPVWRHLAPEETRRALKARLPPVEGSGRFARGLFGGLAALQMAVALVPFSLGVGLGDRVPDWALDRYEPVRPFRVANGYGLFAVMTTTRHEILIEGSRNGADWHPYRFRFKPDDATESPAWSAPHMPRLEWQLWFAALGGPRRSLWVRRLMLLVQEGQPEVLGLFESDPFAGYPPRYVRARLVDYRFGDMSTLWDDGRYWETEDLGLFGPPIGPPPEENESSD